VKKYLLSFAALLTASSAYAAMPSFAPSVNIPQIKAAAAKVAAPTPASIIPAVAGTQPFTPAGVSASWDFSRPSVVLNEWNEGVRQYLPYCDGYVRLELKNGRAYVIFNGVQRCSEYEVRSNDGYRVLDSEKHLEGTYHFGGSYTIPDRSMLLGDNSLDIVLHAEGRYTPFDIVRVEFWAW